VNTTDDYQAIFLNDLPLMDVRAPVEFGKGAFPNAINYPLMIDDERTAVGIRYKEAGQQAAIELGHELIHGPIKQSRIVQWQRFAENHPNGLIYCFRGGLRSQITQQWLSEAGVDVPRVDGGYKAMRHYLLNQLQQRIRAGNILVLSGPTGCGKTDILHRHDHAIDLEKLASHRGSAFGSKKAAQPTQINFENAWSINWMKCHQTSDKPVLFEDESRLIGRIALLPEFQALLLQAPTIYLDDHFTDRVQRIRTDYFEHQFRHDFKEDEEQALKALTQYVQNALISIKKRLGGFRFQSLNELLNQALLLLKNHHRWSGFDPFIELLLREYYDPMYHYQQAQKTGSILFQGNRTEVLQWLNQH
jgi:tRNA 2-selenouridine synthase